MNGPALNDAELLAGFLEEAQQHMAQVEPDLLALESSADTSDPEVIRRLFRAVHSIKGGSGFFGLENINRLTHEMEAILHVLREGKCEVSQPVVDVLFVGYDSLKALLEDVGNSNSMSIDEVMERLQAAGKALKDPVQPPVTSHQSPATSPMASPILSEFKLDLININEIVRKGKYLYRVEFHPEEYPFSPSDNPQAYFADLFKLGEIVQAVAPDGSIVTAADLPASQSGIRLLFATVLDPGLAPVGLGLDPSNIAAIKPEQLQALPPKGLATKPPQTLAELDNTPTG